MKYKYSSGSMDKADGIYFQNMTGKQVEERLKENDIIIIPIGSTEYHGKGQCYGEDTFLVTRMAEIVARECKCTVSQPIWFGSHPWSQLGMPGTIVVPEETFVDYIRAVIVGYWNAGFRKQILINGHGQEYVIPNAIQQFGKIYQVPAVICFVNWPTVIAPYLKDKKHGGQFETPFRHADEVEASYSLALFPEMNHKEDMEDSVPMGFMPEGHVDKGGDIYQYPIPGHGQIGMGGLEVLVYPQGVIGKPTLADASKAEAGLEKLIDYLIKLHNDIREKFPPGKLPDIELVTERDRETIEALIKGPFNGGKSIYSLRYPV
ncbi:3-dehydro-scyllo-inosose hydrolase [Thermoanaerobacterium sp. DL9XJH110]|uniref:3-dehydro-scyllo-inosose hydrolase n=1 Tax=Thermoanaerobacterium sp. DL9XJH110 TaxID=3386643 RepID=UPI003BB5277F